MTYREVVDYLYSTLPMFTRTGAPAYKEGLGNIVALTDQLGEPHKKYPVIHVAGTNGKGSTSHMLAAVLQRCGYKTGLYTSPHLKDFRERIRVNGTPMSQQAVLDFVANNRAWYEALRPSFFELTTAMAFQHFSEQAVDIAVIETGLGGRLDSTNVASPVLSIITNISRDHADLLGDTLEKIAIEKAGIIKTNTPLVVSQEQESVKHVFVDKAKTENAPLTFASQAYRFVSRKYTNGLQEITFNTDHDELAQRVDLPGFYQVHNLAGVLAACDQLRLLGYNIDANKQRDALSNVKQTTGLRGRWDILTDYPLTIADVAHNEDGLRAALEQLRSYNKRRIHFVLGFVKDKDIYNILNLFPRNASYYFCKPDLPRGLDAAELARQASEIGLVGKDYESVKHAWERAQVSAREDDLIYIGGSTFVVAEII